MLNKLYQSWLIRNPVNLSNPHDMSTTTSVCKGPPSGLLAEPSVPSDGTTVTLSSLKDMVAVLKNETLTTLVSQMEVLLKAAEPTCTQARELLEILLCPDYNHREVAAFERRADEGDHTHALAMAIYHDDGQRRQESIKRSVKLYLFAANQPNSIAAMLLGAKYLRGDGVRQDNKLAFHWYKTAAELEHPIAQHKLGYFYDEGLEGACEVSISDAVQWYRYLLLKLLLERFHINVILAVPRNSCRTRCTTSLRSTRMAEATYRQT